MLTNEEIEYLYSERQYFVENRTDVSLDQWLISKGTNFKCYFDFMANLKPDEVINRKINKIRLIAYAVFSPFNSLFFYWTLILCILHKFNFKKPVMKIVIGHFLVRTTGNVLDSIGNIFREYYSLEEYYNDNNQIAYRCKYGNNMHPLRWFIARQIGTLFWYSGEMIADWYPILRTKAVVKNKSIWYVYFTCGLFNLSKVALITLHFSLSPTRLYKEDGLYDKDLMNYFYFKYWIIQLIVIYTSIIYDISVFYVLKKNIFKVTKYDFGFLKKFKTLSEYRIFVSAIISIIFLPWISITIIVKWYYYVGKGYTNLNFSFEEIRTSIANMQYYMIFIDQILLIYSNNELNNFSRLKFYSNALSKETSNNGISNNDISNTLSANDQSNDHLNRHSYNKRTTIMTNTSILTNNTHNTHNTHNNDNNDNNDKSNDDSHGHRHSKYNDYSINIIPKDLMNSNEENDITNYTNDNEKMENKSINEKNNHFDHSHDDQIFDSDNNHNINISNNNNNPINENDNNNNNNNNNSINYYNNLLENSIDINNLIIKNDHNHNYDNDKT